MNRFLLILLFFVITSVNLKLFSQCSDAGICFIGKKHMEMMKDINSVSIGYNYGYSGDINNIYFHTFKLEGDFKIINNVRLGFSMPFSIISGPLGDVNGAGDLITMANVIIPIKHKVTLNIELGGKFATGKVNTADSLSQSYMPGLGTNDLLIGAGYTIPNFNIAAGYQKTFGRSANIVTRLKRGDDLFFRAGYNQTFKKVNVKAEVETIVKLQPQNIQSYRAPDGVFYTVDGSNQSQVNLTGQITYSASEKIDIKLYTSVPLLKRDYNYDGLKRTFSAGLSADYLFNVKKK